jgi:hypothetical protein
MKQIVKLAGWTEEVPKYRSIKGRQAEIKNKAGKSWHFYVYYGSLKCLWGLI